MAKRFDDLVARTTSPKVRAAAATRAHGYLAQLLLKEVRQRRGLSQKQLAATLRIKQPSLSKLERQPDMHVSTLRRIVEALGGRLVITAEFPDESTVLSRFSHANRTPRPIRNAA